MPSYITVRKSNIEIGSGETKEILDISDEYYRGKVIVFGIVASDPNVNIRCLIDGYPIAFPTIEDLYDCGVTAPNSIYCSVYDTVSSRYGMVIRDGTIKFDRGFALYVINNSASKASFDCVLILEVEG